MSYNSKESYHQQRKKMRESVDKNVGTDRFNKLQSLVNGFSPTNRRRFAARSFKAEINNGKNTNLETTDYTLKSLGFTAKERSHAKKMVKKYPQGIF